MPSMEQNDAFLESIYTLYAQEYAPSYPHYVALRKDVFLKHIRKLLAMKGSGDSIKTFFRVAYGQEVDVLYPKDRRLTHDSKSVYIIRTDVDVWYERERTIKDFNNLVGQYVSGNFGASAQVQRITTRDVRIDGLNRMLITIELGNMSGGGFSAGELIEYTLPDYRYLTFRVGGIITDYKISNAGTGYKIGDEIIIANGYEKVQAKAIVKKVGSDGEIVSVKILDAGYGYRDSVRGKVKSVLGKGAVIDFIGGSFTRWTKRPDAKIIFADGDKYALGEGGNNNEYAYDPLYEEPYVAFDYTETKTGSVSYSDYAPVSLISNDPKTFGKLYFELHLECAYTFIGSDIRIGVVNEKHTFGTPLGETANSWAFDINATSSPFVHGGQRKSLVYDRSDWWERSIYRFVVDTIENKIYIGNHNGWFGDAAGGGLTRDPVHPVFEGIHFDQHLNIALTGRLTPASIVKIVAQYQDFGFPVPKYIGSEDETKTASNSFAYDYDPYQLKVQAWDSSLSSQTLMGDMYKFTTENYLYRYKIRTELSSNFWKRVYRTCIHPVGTSYTVDILNTAYAVGEGHNVSVQNARVDVELISITTPTLDIRRRDKFRLSDTFDAINSGGNGPMIEDVRTFIYDQDVIVNSMESSVRVKSIMSTPPAGGGSGGNPPIDTLIVIEQETQ